MAKSTGLKRNVSLGGKKKLPVSKSIATEKIDKIARSITTEKTSPIKEKTTRITLDVPQSLYKKMKLKTFDEELTLKSYVLSLVRKDLG